MRIVWLTTGSNPADINRFHIKIADHGKLPAVGTSLNNLPRPSYVCVFVCVCVCVFVYVFVCVYVCVYFSNKAMNDSFCLKLKILITTELL